MILSECISEFIIDQKVKGNSHLTVSYYERSLKLFVGFLGDISVDELSLLKCKQFVLYLQNDGSKNSVTIQTYVRGVRAFLSWLYMNEYIDFCLTEKFKLPKAQSKIKDILTPAEIDILFKAFDETTFLGIRNSCIVSFMLGSGCRCCEIVSLKSDSVHIEEGYALVLGKGNKQRNVPIGDIAKDKLRLYISLRPDSEYFFVQENGAPITSDTLKDLFRKLKIKTGISRLHAHLLRHTFATMYLNNGGNIYTLQTILGHTSLEMVKKYLHIAPYVVVNDFHKYSPIDKKSPR